MSIELYFFRHGIAIDRDDPSVKSDPERALTAEGIQKTRAAAEGFKRLDVKVEKIFTSPWVRAAQTAQILSKVLGVKPVHELPELAGDRTPEQLLKALEGERAERIMLVGHEPLLSTTVERLLGCSQESSIDLKKAGACAVQIDSLHRAKGGVLLWLLTSKQLRMIAEE